MDVNEYQRLSVRTVNRALDRETALLIAGLGICGESGEVADILKKAIGQGHGLGGEMRKKLLDEIGDTCWYVAYLCELLDVELGDVLRANIVKLERRYPAGFTPERSLHRAEAE